ncbi:hypothetical protein CFP56_001003 [Quercus suber]|uniref:Uncharacterized protein n=1 Tax=Quercus suber TaxID=58331 RepID=A0AAW0LHG0_QUESU
MELPMRRLTRKIDEDGNSVLHTVGKKSKDYVHEKMQGPALELQDELRWFERVKVDTPTHYLHHRNNQKLTAEGLFDETNKELREKGIEWIKRTAQGCSAVAVLIATVAFALLISMRERECERVGGVTAGICSLNCRGIPSIRNGIVHFATVEDDKKHKKETKETIEEVIWLCLLFKIPWMMLMKGQMVVSMDFDVHVYPFIIS